MTLLPSSQLLETGIRVPRVAKLPPPSNAMGEALGQVGDVLAQVQQKVAQANDIRGITEAGIAMRDELVSFADWQSKNQDETQWAKEWESRQSRLSESFAKINLSKDGKLRLQDRFSRFNTNATLDLQGNIIRQTGARMQASQDAALLHGERTGDFQPYIDSVKSQEAAGLKLPEQAKLDIERGLSVAVKRQIGDYKARRANAIRNENYEEAAALDKQAFESKILTDAEYQNAQDLNVKGQLFRDIKSEIVKDPRKAKEMISSYELPDDDRRGLERLADNTLSEYRNGELRQIADAVTTGDIKRGEEVRFGWIDSPADQAEIRAKINEAPISAEQLVPEVIGLEAAIAQFNTDALNQSDPAATREMIDISARVSKLPTHVKDRISSKWQGRLSGKAPSTKESFVGTGQGIIKELYQVEEDKFFKGSGADKALRPGKEGEWAQFKLRLAKMDNDLKQLMPDNPTPEKAMEIIQQVTGSAASTVRKKVYETPAINPGQRWDIPMRRPEGSANKPQASANPNRYQVTPDGWFSGLASSYGYEGDADNGNNSLGFYRGKQPWANVAPTVALPPDVAKSLGVKMPKKAKDDWDLSESFVEIEVDGKSVTAIYDEEGMTIHPNSLNKMVDLTPEVSDALGLPVKSNHPVKIRKAGSNG
jgi:hypothetical protein